MLPIAILRRALGEDRDFDFLQRCQAALRRHFEAANRFHFVAKELDSHRIHPVGREDVQDAATRRKLSRQLDGAGVMKTTGRQPGRQLIDLNRVATANSPGLTRELFQTGHRLQQALNAGHDQPRWLPAGQGLEQPQPLAVRLVIDQRFALFAFPSRESMGPHGGEQRQVRTKVIQIVHLGPDDYYRTGGMPNQRGRHQRAARPPDSAQRGGMPRLQAGDYLGEAPLRFQTPNQIEELIGRGINRLRPAHELVEF